MQIYLPNGVIPICFRSHRMKDGTELRTITPLRSIVQLKTDETNQAQQLYRQIKSAFNDTNDIHWT